MIAQEQYDKLLANVSSLQILFALLCEDPLLSKIIRHHPEFPAVPWGKGLSEAVFQDQVCPFSHYKF